MRRRINAVRVGSSNHAERLAELKANHEEFERMLADGWQVTNTRVKRPRIQKAKTPHKVEVSIMNGLVKVIVDFTEWQAHGSIGRIIKEIY